MKLGSFIAGMGVGAVTALVFAPRSGEDTREILSEKMEEGKQYAKKSWSEYKLIPTQAPVMPPAFEAKPSLLHPLFD